MFKYRSLNPFACLWKQLTTSQIIVQRMSKYIKLVNIATVQALSFVENGRCFNTLNIMKIKTKNQLTIHLLKKFIFTFEIFPYDQAIEECKVTHN